MLGDYGNEAAFARLYERASQRSNVKLRVLAAQIVSATAEGAARQARSTPSAPGGANSVLPFPEPDEASAGPAEPAAAEDQAE